MAHAAIAFTDQGTSIRERAKNIISPAEREHIKSILKETNGLVSGPKGAAARLGMKRSTLNFRMKKLGIIRPPMQ